jgi:hypothetical protein
VAVIAEYQLDGNANDSAGANNGELKGSPAFGGSLLDFEPGGQAIVLNGTSQYVQIPNAAALQLTGSYWFSAWVKRSKEAPNQTIIGKGAEGDYFLELRGEKLVCGHRDTGGVYREASATVSVSPGRRFRVDGTYDGANIRIFVNGREVGSAAITKGPASTAGTLNIGASSGGVFLFAGSIDKAIVRNAAGTAAEILAAYRAESSVLLEEGWESGSLDLAYYARSTEGVGSKTEVVSGADPAPFAGAYLLRSEVPSGSNRAEVNPSHLLLSQGDDVYIRGRFYLKAGFASTGWGNVLWQIRDEGNGSPVAGLYVMGGRIYVKGGPATGLSETIYWEGPAAETGRWYDIATRVLCDESAANGRVQVWLDRARQQMVNTAGKTAIGKGYPKFGLYRDPTIASTGVVAHDELTITRSLPFAEATTGTPLRPLSRRNKVLSP